jgi:hypothetical protein
MEAADSTETLTNIYDTTRYHNPIRTNVSYDKWLELIVPV